MAFKNTLMSYTSDITLHMLALVIQTRKENNAMKKHGHHPVSTAIILIMLAGWNAQPDDTSTAPVQPPPAALTLDDIDRYFLSLKKWAELSPAKPDHAGQPVGEPSKSTENGYECASQDDDISKTPDELVMFSDKDADVLWPGALVQG